MRSLRSIAGDLRCTSYLGSTLFVVVVVVPEFQKYFNADEFSLRGSEDEEAEDVEANLHITCVPYLILAMYSL